MSPEVTLSLDSSMVEPSETMVMVKEVTRRMRMTLLMPDCMRGVKAELLLPAVRLNKRLSFCHRSGTGMMFMVPSELEAQNT